MTRIARLIAAAAVAALLAAACSGGAADGTAATASPGTTAAAPATTAAATTSTTEATPTTTTEADPSAVSVEFAEPPQAQRGWHGTPGGHGSVVATYRVQPADAVCAYSLYDSHGSVIAPDTQRHDHTGERRAILADYKVGDEAVPLTLTVVCAGRGPDAQTAEATATLEPTRKLDEVTLPDEPEADEALPESAEPTASGETGAADTGEAVVADDEPAEADEPVVTEPDDTAVDVCLELSIAHSDALDAYIGDQQSHELADAALTAGDDYLDKCDGDDRWMAEGSNELAWHAFIADRHADEQEAATTCDEAEWAASDAQHAAVALLEATGSDLVGDGTPEQTRGLRAAAQVAWLAGRAANEACGGASEWMAGEGASFWHDIFAAWQGWMIDKIAAENGWWCTSQSVDRGWGGCTTVDDPYVHLTEKSLERAAG